MGLGRVEDAWTKCLTDEKCLFERVILLTALYGAETWGMKKVLEKESECS